MTCRLRPRPDGRLVVRVVARTNLLPSPIRNPMTPPPGVKSIAMISPDFYSWARFLSSGVAFLHPMFDNCGGPVTRLLRLGGDFMMSFARRELQSPRCGFKRRADCF